MLATLVAITSCSHSAKVPAASAAPPVDPGKRPMFEIEGVTRSGGIKPGGFDVNHRSRVYLPNPKDCGPVIVKCVHAFAAAHQMMVGRNESAQPNRVQMQIQEKPDASRFIEVLYRFDEKTPAAHVVVNVFYANGDSAPVEDVLPRALSEELENQLTEAITCP